MENGDSSPNQNDVDKNEIEVTKDESDIVSAWESLSPRKQERILAIKEMKRKGATHEMIGKLFGVVGSTIASDIEWMKRHLVVSVDTFNQRYQIGETIDLFNEITDKAMAKFDETTVETEKEVVINGVKERVLVPPDHSSATKYLQVAMQAREKLNQLLKEVGMMNTVPQRIEVGGTIDISKLRSPDDFERAEKEIENRIIDARRRFSKLEVPDPLKGRNS